MHIIFLETNTNFVLFTRVFGYFSFLLIAFNISYSYIIKKNRLEICNVVCANAYVKLNHFNAHIIAWVRNYKKPLKHNIEK